MSFRDRHEQMGLRDDGNGSFIYSDRFSKVAYKELTTKDNIDVPALGVFTSRPTPNMIIAPGATVPPEVWKLTGIVSDDYKFTGNEVINNQIKNSIGNALFKETVLMNVPHYTQMRSELVISNNKSIRSVGDIYPQVVVENNYNGKKKISISFGLMVNDSERRSYSFSFRNKLISLSQVHLESARTRSTEIGRFVTVFNQNIEELIEANFNRPLTDEDVFTTLEMIEKIGKRKREAISVIAQEMGENKTNWGMFLAIVKYSTNEKNLNVKTYLENAAERVLVVPTQLSRLVSEINKIQDDKFGAETLAA